MPLIEVQAKWECDECGRLFTVVLDAAYEGVTFDNVINALLNSHCYKGEGEDNSPRWCEVTGQSSAICSTCVEALRNEQKT